MSENTLWCPKCAENKRVALVKRPLEADAEQEYGCPRCHGRFAEAEGGEMVRVAQFGGIGGGPAGWAPGSSPMGRHRGTSNGAGRLYSGAGTAKDMQSVLQRTYNPPDPDPTRNWEKRLEPFHQHDEENQIPYHLSLQERHRLRVRKQIRLRQEYLADCAKSMEENSVPFIRENFHPKPQQVITLEEALDSKRRLKDDDRSPLEDDVPPQEPAQRRHYEQPTYRHASPKVNRSIQTIFDNPEDEEAPKDPFGADKNRKHKTQFDGYINHTPVMNTGLEVEQNLGKLNDYTQWLNESTILDFYPDVDEPARPNPDPVPSPLIDNAEQAEDGNGPMKLADDPNVPLEGKLSALNDSEPKRAPQITRKAPRYDEWKHEGKEPQGNADSYPSQPGTSPTRGQSYPSL